MVAGRAHYVWGKQADFPYGERWISGPFDDPFDASTECERVRPLYPEARLSVRIRTGKTLPICRPRVAPLSFDLKRKDGRADAAAAIVALVEGKLGLRAEVTDWGGEPDVTCTAPNLSCLIGLDYFRYAPLPIISWYGARFPLRGVPGAWGDGDVNWSHRAKATSLPRDWGEMFSMLEIGLLASIDGGAFDLGVK
jgi:hypothetical protein